MEATIGEQNRPAILALARDVVARLQAGEVLNRQAIFRSALENGAISTAAFIAGGRVLTGWRSKADPEWDMYHNHIKYAMKKWEKQRDAQRATCIHHAMPAEGYHQMHPISVPPGCINTAPMIPCHPVHVYAQEQIAPRPPGPGSFSMSNLAGVDPRANVAADMLTGLAAAAAQHPQASLPDPMYLPTDNALVWVTRIPGKGYGAKAKVALPLGSLILLAEQRHYSRCGGGYRMVTD